MGYWVETGKNNWYYKTNTWFYIWIYHNNNTIIKLFLLSPCLKSRLGSIRKNVPSNTSRVPWAKHIINQESMHAKGKMMVVNSQDENLPILIENSHIYHYLWLIFSKIIQTEGTSDIGTKNPVYVNILSSKEWNFLLE